MSIPSFISQLGTVGLARSNRFEAIINFPTRIQSFANFGLTRISVESAEMPSIGVATTEAKYDQSPNIALPYQRQPSGQCTIVFRLDEKHTIRQAMNAWVDSIINTPQSFNLFGYSKNYYVDYVGTVTIMQLGIDLKPKSSVTLVNAYPLNIDSVRYDWADNDQYQKLSVTFAYIDQRNDYF